MNTAKTRRPASVMNDALSRPLLALACGLALCVSVSQAQPLTSYVDPFIGTGAHGHTFPGATTPHGLVQLSPDNEKRGWDWCSGYHESDNVIVGFSHTHLSGTGVGDLMDVVIMPTTKKATADTSRQGGNFIYQFKNTFSHENEAAEPGYYTVTLDDPKVKVELTASPRVGFHRITFPADQAAKLIIDLSSKGGSDRQNETTLKQTDDTTLVGHEFTRGWARDQRVYFVARFSRPIKSLVLSKSGELTTPDKEVTGKAAKAVIDFGVLGKNPLLVKVGISSSGIDGAIKNLETEVPRWSFNRVRKAASKVWEKELSKFTIKDESQDRKTIFYTALYHAAIAPNLYSDVDGKYRGMDGKVHQAEGFNNYFTFSLWDTFRALHPLMTLMDESLVAGFVNAMLSQYQESGLLPVWSLWGNETNCMPGYHAVPVIVDAYLKGIRGFDVELAYEAIKASSMQNIRSTDLYRQYGYIPHDLKPESVSTTLEYAFDDWCIAQMAKAMGKDDDYATYAKRARSYVHLGDKTTGFMRPKNADGSWMTPFDPGLAQRGNGFTEGNSWQYSWFVPHDVPGLMDIMGGEQAFVQKLDTLFTQETASDIHISDVTGLVGQYAHGNEPSHHVAYLYSFAGQSWKTQARVAMIRDTLYTAQRDGLCGNDDCGQMSAWYVFSSLGFYPVNAASGVYVFGSPLFEQVTMHLSNGKTLMVKTKRSSDKDVYIQSVTRNGKPYAKAYITHLDIMTGGTLEFVMGDTPNKQFGQAPEDRP